MKREQYALIESSAPGRCGIVGNPSDMYGGAVLSISTRERARCCLGERAPSTPLVAEVCGEILPLTCASDLTPRDDHFELVRATLRTLGIDVTRLPYNITLSTDIPMQAGLAGSTALIVTLLAALNKALGLGLYRWTLAEKARSIEFDGMGIVCGFQDQHMAVCGGMNYMEFAGKAEQRSTGNAPFATVESLEAPVPRPLLVAAHTGVRHHSGTVHRSPRERWLAGDRDVKQAYEEIAALARSAKRALIESDFAGLGALMNRNHEIVLGLGGSGEENERLIAVARTAGALGAKLAGAGGGGTILVLCTNSALMKHTLLGAGASRVMTPEGGVGVTVDDYRADGLLGSIWAE